MQRSVCILDDDPVIGAVLTRMMTTNGFAAQEFTTAAPFLTQVQNTNPELIILDLALGRLDAIDIIRQLDRVRFKGHIILISGHASDILSDAEQIGVRHGLRMLPSLRKPFRLHQFNAALRALDKMSFAREAAPMAPAAPKEALKIAFEEALGNRWLEVWYQPKIDLKSLSVCGAEALVRMRHPIHGVLPPAHFLPPPGDPLHRRLARAVLKRAMADWRTFAASNINLRLAVNVPVSVLNSAEFVSFVRTVVPKDLKFPGLILELTEDEAIGNPDAVREVATQLRLNKVTMSIDDFGSAYASLSRLTEMPVGELKLDAKFVRGCASDKSKRSVCRIVIDLAHEFGASVCAEAVEDTVDLRALMDMGCDVAQGFLFAEPMPVEELVQFLALSPGRAAGMDPLGESAGAPSPAALGRPDARAAR